MARPTKYQTFVVSAEIKVLKNGSEITANAMKNRLKSALEKIADKINHAEAMETN